MRSASDNSFTPSSALPHGSSAVRRSLLVSVLRVCNTTVGTVPLFSRPAACAILNQSSMNKVAVVYARVSSKDQEREGFSIPAQLDLLRSYAAGRQLKIVEEFVHVETAKQAGRSAFGRMIAFARKHRGRLIVLVEKTDRLYRN